MSKMILHQSDQSQLQVEGPRKKESSNKKRVLSTSFVLQTGSNFVVSSPRDELNKKN